MYADWERRAKRRAATLRNACGMLLPGLSFKIPDLQSDKVAAVGSRAPRALSAVAATCRRN